MRSATDAWTGRYELERLTQLRADVESAHNRYITECLREAMTRSDADQEEWMRRAGNAERYRDAMLQDLDRWIKRWCEEQNPPGC